MPQWAPMDLGPFTRVEGHAEAASLDEADPLAEFRERFVVADESLIYLDGNSLGRLPHKASTLLDDAISRQWGDRLIRSWNEGWWELQLEIGDKLAPLLGAQPGEVIISDSTSVNLYKLAASALDARPDRSKIVTDDLNFPTDVYVLQGIAARVGKELVIVPSDGIEGPVEGLKKAIDADTALVSLSHTAFKSGYTYDLDDLTSAAHDAGAMILWDCSHSVGSLPIDLANAGVDLAVGCTYKYLNGGPGSPAFLYVRRDLQGQLTNPITAWWGHADPFGFGLGFEPVEGIRRFHTGTMPILSLVPVEAGISDVADAGIDRLRAKSKLMSEFLISQVDRYLSPLGFVVASPRDPDRRGSHVSVAHELAWPVTRALIDRGKVIPDFRTPDNIRLGLSPLYNTFVEVHTAVQRLKSLVESGTHLDYLDARAAVT